jgi:hypothetical protein
MSFGAASRGTTGSFGGFAQVAFGPSERGGGVAGGTLATTVKHLPNPWRLG